MRSGVASAQGDATCCCHVTRVHATRARHGRRRERRVRARARRRGRRAAPGEEGFGGGRPRHARVGRTRSRGVQHHACAGGALAALVLAACAEHEAARLRECVSARLSRSTLLTLLAAHRAPRRLRRPPRRTAAGAAASASGELAPAVPDALRRCSPTARRASEPHLAAAPLRCAARRGRVPFAAVGARAGVTWRARCLRTPCRGGARAPRMRCWSRPSSLPPRRGCGAAARCRRYAPRGVITDERASRRLFRTGSTAAAAGVAPLLPLHALHGL